MIARLRGMVRHNDGEQLILDVNGVGYLLTISERVYSRLERQSANEVELIVHTDVKENDISLFGFEDELEKQVFLLLKKVKGIGSRLALTIVSALGSEQLLSLIGSGDVAALQGVPGIGKKTAERVIVELREQVGQMATPGASLSLGIEKSSSQQRVSEERGPYVDAVLALQKLGFPEERAKKAVEEVREQMSLDGPLDAGELLQNALMQIAG